MLISHSWKELVSKSVQLYFTPPPAIFDIVTDEYSLDLIGLNPRIPTLMEKNENLSTILSYSFPNSLTSLKIDEQEEGFMVLSEFKEGLEELEDGESLQEAMGDLIKVIDISHLKSVTNLCTNTFVKAHWENLQNLHLKLNTLTEDPCIAYPHEFFPINLLVNLKVLTLQFITVPPNLHEFQSLESLTLCVNQINEYDTLRLRSSTLLELTICITVYETTRLASFIESMPLLKTVKIIKYCDENIGLNVDADFTLGCPNLELYTINSIEHEIKKRA